MGGHRRRVNWSYAAPALGVATLSLFVYLRTLSPGLTWLHHGADGGDFAAAVASGGVPHPSGYPTYMLLGRLFAALPVGDIAFRLNLLSAVCAAAAAGLACAIAIALNPPPSAPAQHQEQKQARSSHQHKPQNEHALTGVAAAVAAFIFAFAPVLWSQAVITEVYSLNALFCTALLLLAIARPRRLGLMCFLLGLGLGNHLSLVFLLPSLALLRAFAIQGLQLEPDDDAGRQNGRAGAILRPILAFLTGLLVYCYLPLSASTNPYVNWGDPRTPDRLLWMVAGAPYRGYLFSVPPSEIMTRFSAWANLLVQQLTWPGAALMMLGLWDMLAEPDKRPVVSLALPFALYSIYALAYRTADSYVYLIPAYLVAVLWLARGAVILIRSAQTWAATSSAAALGAKRTSVLIASLLFLLPIWQLATNWTSVDASHDRTAQTYAETVLAALPPRALVITASDEHTFSLWYYLVANGRWDILVVDRDLTQFAWFREQIRRQAPDLAAAPDSDSVTTYMASLVKAARSQRDVFLADEDRALLEQFAWQREGTLLRMVSR